MKEVNEVLKFIGEVLKNQPEDWLKLTTHRLDIYEESRAKTQFLEEFEKLYRKDKAEKEDLHRLPTAFDYIRLGHPLSSILEWALAKLSQLPADKVISFDSATIPLMAILRENLLKGQPTLICHYGQLPEAFDEKILRSVYGYQFELKQVDGEDNIPDFEGSKVFFQKANEVGGRGLRPSVDFYVHQYADFGSVLWINGAQNQAYVPHIQHVRRRETIAMTPQYSEVLLKHLVNQSTIANAAADIRIDQTTVFDLIQQITGTSEDPLIASSGLSMQYAIMMGLIHHAKEQHPGKDIRFIVPVNCYGGTNDQARRVAACLPEVQVIDLAVDRENNMVQSIDQVLEEVAAEDAVPYIIAEIPTNPRVEVPDLEGLRKVLSKKRETKTRNNSIEPVFILDQTFCPNVPFLKEGQMLSSVQALAYVSGSKFPSGGKCTAGYCVANQLASGLMDKIALHLKVCDNQATPLQMQILTEQLPTMEERIRKAYQNTVEFVSFIRKNLANAKINFVSETLADEGFTPSVFSLDLPAQGNTAEEREMHKRELNLRLIQKMITEIPDECKFCVSYGQLKGSYWTIPATSTQGTTREGDKDYIVRVALSPQMNMEKHKQVFKDFVSGI